MRSAMSSTTSVAEAPTPDIILITLVSAAKTPSPLSGKELRHLQRHSGPIQEMPRSMGCGESLIGVGKRMAWFLRAFAGAIDTSRVTVCTERRIYLPLLSSRALRESSRHLHRGHLPAGAVSVGRFLGGKLDPCDSCPKFAYGLSVL